LRSDRERADAGLRGGAWLPAAIAGTFAVASAAFVLTAAPAAGQDRARSPNETTLDTLQELWDALGACWAPPPRDQARPGTQITIRFSLDRAGAVIGEPRFTYSTPALPDAVRAAYQRSLTAALRRCTPLPLSSGLGGAIAGRPIAARFIDDRDD
jgi:hypothetical protein